jgi:hypothetical protein
MKSSWKVVLCFFVAALLPATLMFSSEIVGIYVKVDRVIFEPNEAAAERIQVWGIFSTERNRSGAQRGYMYFSLPAGFHPTVNAAAKAEWADLKSVAGTGQVVAFGQRFFPLVAREAADKYFAGLPRVRQASEKPQTPDLYPVNIGLAKISNSPIADQLRSAK